MSRLQERIQEASGYSRQALFNPLPGQPQMVDGTVTNFLWWPVPMVVYFAAPDPSALRFIVFFRDPADRLFSHYSMYSSRGKTPGSEPFEEYTEDYAARRDRCFNRELKGNPLWEKLM